MGGRMSLNENKSLAQGTVNSSWGWTDGAMSAGGEFDSWEVLGRSLQAEWNYVGCKYY